MNPEHWFSDNTPLIIGHRGASDDAPENSLTAFALAIEHGADGIELDVQLTADGYPAIFHDATLKRLAGKNDKVNALTRVQLKDVDIGQGQTIPTLDELFDLLGNQTLYNIELKNFSLWDSGVETAVAELVSRYSLDDRVLISSFNPLSIRRARRVFARSTPVALIRMPGITCYSYLLGRGEADNPHYSLVNARYMAWAKNQGLFTFVWTVDDLPEAQRLVELGIRGIITNKPGFLGKNLR